MPWVPGARAETAIWRRRVIRVVWEKADPARFEPTGTMAVHLLAENPRTLCNSEWHQTQSPGPSPAPGSASIRAMTDESEFAPTRVHWSKARLARGHRIEIQSALCFPAIPWHLRRETCGLSHVPFRVPCPALGPSTQYLPGDGLRICSHNESVVLAYGDRRLHRQTRHVIQFHIGHA